MLSVTKLIFRYFLLHMLLTFNFISIQFPKFFIWKSDHLFGFSLEFKLAIRLYPKLLSNLNRGYRFVSFNF